MDELDIGRLERMETFGLTDRAANQIFQMLPELDIDTRSEFINTVDRAIGTYVSVKMNKAQVLPQFEKDYPVYPAPCHLKPSERIKIANKFLYHAKALLSWMEEYRDIDNHIPSVIWNKRTGEPEPNDCGWAPSIVPWRASTAIEAGEDYRCILIEHPRQALIQLLEDCIDRAECDDGVIAEAKFQQDLNRRQQSGLARRLMMEEIITWWFNHIRDKIPMKCSYDTANDKGRGKILQVFKIVLDGIGEQLHLNTIYKEIKEIKSKLNIDNI